LTTATYANPWTAHGWFRNPFGELTAAERGRLAIVDWDRLAMHVGKPRTAVQFVGDCGRGKTTRLMAIHGRFDDASYVYLPEGEPTPPIAMGTPLLIDEAQRLPRSVRQIIFSSGVPLVIATHRDLTRPLRRSRYDVHTEAIGGGNDADHVRQILNARIIASQRPDRSESMSKHQITVEEAEHLVRRFGSDVRAIEHHLYERVQHQVMGHGEVRFID
jgi:hypothetical protein